MRRWWCGVGYVQVRRWWCGVGVYTGIRVGIFKHHVGKFFVMLSMDKLSLPEVIVGFYVLVGHMTRGFSEETARKLTWCHMTNKGCGHDRVPLCPTGGGSDGVEGDHFTEQELADLEKAKDLILKRQEAENGRSQAENGRSRQNDFLQSMTMKIRFMKRLTSDDLERNEGGKIIFNSCDQVQMKLTQLELNSVRLLTSPDSVTIEGGGGSDTIHIPGMTIEGGG